MVVDLKGEFVVIGPFFRDSLEESALFVFDYLDAAG